MPTAAALVAIAGFMLILPIALIAVAIGIMLMIWSGKKKA